MSLESLYHCHWSWGCQAFSDYQMQQMTSNFIDQFGFNDEKFADQDDIGKWVYFLASIIVSYAPALCETFCDFPGFLELVCTHESGGTYPSRLILTCQALQHPKDREELDSLPLRGIAFGLDLFHRSLFLLKRNSFCCSSVIGVGGRTNAGNPCATSQAWAAPSLTAHSEGAGAAPPVFPSLGYAP